jgi:phage baseplate assembly protein W
VNALVCDWGGDLLVGSTGDIGVAPIQVEVQQRIVRRLLTNPGEYIWHIAYGAGLGSFVGKPYSPALIEGTVLSQLMYEALIRANPSPTVLTSQSTAGSFSSTSLTIQYQVGGVLTSSSVVLELGT